jgi:deazaflavin-dependent oxidoreductase (nitroreductase family)
MRRNFGNGVVVAILRSPLHGLLGQDFALIEFTGRSTGRAYTVPVNAFAGEDGYLIISRRERTWWRNLRDRPSATLRHRGRARPMQAQVIDNPPEVAELLRLHLRSRPSHARFLGVSMGRDGEPDATQLGQAAQDRVLIRLRPA